MRSRGCSGRAPCRVSVAGHCALFKRERAEDSEKATRSSVEKMSPPKRPKRKHVVSSDNHEVEKGAAEEKEQTGERTLGKRLEKREMEAVEVERGGEAMPLGCLGEALLEKVASL